MTTQLAPDIPRTDPEAGEPSRSLAAGSLTCLAVGAGLAAGVAPEAALAGAAVVVLVVLVALRPVSAAYLWLGATPLIVGIDRGTALPVLRPNEALLLLLIGTLAARWLVLLWLGRAGRPKLGALDAWFFLLALTGAALPLLWVLARGRALAVEDLLYAATVVKYYLVFVLVRIAVHNQTQARRCLWVALCAGAVVAVVAVLQSLRLFGVPELLSTYWAPAGRSQLSVGRGSSTIGVPAGTADVMIFSFAISAGMILTHSTRRKAVLLGLSATFVVGALASGQTAGLIGLLVGVLAVGIVTRRLLAVLWAVVAITPVVAFLVAPVVALRLAQRDERSGVPASWLARWDNLTTYFWPELFSNYSWILGVQPMPEAQGQESWQGVVYIESGHTWLLWIGGLPFLLAFLCFVRAAIRTAARTARSSTGAFAAAGVAAFTAWWVIAVVTVFDPHVFLRGSADLSFPLLALAMVGAAHAHPRASGAGAAEKRMVMSGPPGPGRSRVPLDPRAPR